MNIQKHLLEVFCKKCVLRIFLKFFQNSQENTFARVCFLIKLQAEFCNFTKKETLAQVLSCEFCKISKSIFFYRTPLVAVSEQLSCINLVLCSFFRNLCISVISPHLNYIYEVPLKLNALVSLMSLVPEYFVVQLKEELKTENHLSTFVVVGVVNTEIFMSFVKLPFCKQTF